MQDRTAQNAKMADTRRYVEFYRIECRECDWESGEPIEAADTVDDAWVDHFKVSGHRHSWNYTIARSDAITEAIETLRARMQEQRPM
jgi:hypothetical protein